LAFGSRTRGRGFFQIRADLPRKQPSRSASHQKASASIATQQAPAGRAFPLDRCHGGFSDRKTDLADATQSRVSSLFNLAQDVWGGQ
jgi:hypothetical protein